MQDAIAQRTARSEHHEANTAGDTVSTLRWRGVALAAGALSYSGATFAYGFNPTSSAHVAITDLAGLTFQAGVFALVDAQIRTRATGLTRKAMAMLKVERVLLSLAMLWSLLHAVLPGQRDALWLGILDLAWPLSMLGMFVISVKVAFAGRWRGVARYWALVAESWVVVTLPSMAVLGRDIGTYVGALHLLVGYATLGVIIATKPQLLP